MKKDYKIQKQITKYIVPLTIAIGLTIGTAAAYITFEEEQKENYCSTLGEDLQTELDHTDSVKCHEPGLIQFPEEEVPDEADLRCACRITLDNQVEIYPIYSTDAQEEIQQQRE